MYTYEDWLEDRLEISPFPDDMTSEKKQFSMLPPSILFNQNKMSKETFDMITENQKESYNRALELHFEFHKACFNIDYRNSINPKEYLEIEIKKLKKKKEEDIELYQFALKEKAYSYITGSDYKKISDYWEDYVVNKRFHAFKLNLSMYMDIFKMHLLIKQLEYLERILSQQNQTELKGIKTNKTSESIKGLFNQLKGEYISNETNIEHFEALFIDKHLPFDFIKIKWVFKEPKGNPHKTAFREFLKVVFGECPNQKCINTLFSDNIGNPIKLAKPKHEPNTQYWTDIFEKMIS